MDCFPIHVVHVVYRFAPGGLENVVVQLVNHLPAPEFRHTVVALTEVDAGFAARITRADVELIALGKAPGQTLWLYPRVYRLFRRLRADVLHTCNLAAMELTPVAAAAGIPRRVHAEHGWDLRERAGEAGRYRLLRRLCRPFVDEFVVVAEPLLAYMREKVGVPAGRLHLIENGVDTARFRPRAAGDRPPADFPFAGADTCVIGTVGRLETIKNPGLLLDAFRQLVESGRAGAERLRLVMVGDGTLAGEMRERVRAAGLQDRVWLPGNRADIADILRALDCFVLPSLSEATSCVLQEAMASGLEIVATAVGGTPDLLGDGRYGRLAPSGDAPALAAAIWSACHADASERLGPLARQRIEERYALPAIMARYRALFAPGRAAKGGE